MTSRSRGTMTASRLRACAAFCRQQGANRAASDIEGRARQIEETNHEKVIQATNGTGSAAAVPSLADSRATRER